MFDSLIDVIKKRKLERKQEKIEQEYQRLQFEISQLYVGEIVLYKERINKGNNISNYRYYPVKKFAIFTQTGASQYLHIKSKQKLHKMGLFAIEGDYAVINIKTFQERFAIAMRNYNLDLSSKISMVVIEELENQMNNKHAPEQNVPELFK